MPGKRLWRSIKRSVYLRAACVKASPGSLGPHDCRKDLYTEAHMTLSDGSASENHPECVFFKNLGFEITTENNRGARPQATLIWTHLVAVFNWCSALCSDFLQLCGVRLLKERGEQMKRVLASYGVAYWTLVRDPGPNRGPSCEVIQAEGRILHASEHCFVGGTKQGWGANLLAVILVPTYWISVK